MDEHTQRPIIPASQEGILHVPRDTWWTISGTEFRRALQLVADGESPDVVYAEFYANTENDAGESLS